MSMPVRGVSSSVRCFEDNTQTYIFIIVSILSHMHLQRSVLRLNPTEDGTNDELHESSG